MMSQDYTKNVALLKVFADTSRLLIIEMLSCGEVCACKLLEKLEITQSTLSHHMKIFCESGLVNSRKDGRWTYYTLNKQAVDKFLAFLTNITTTKENCICEEVATDGVCEC